MKKAKVFKNLSALADCRMTPAELGQELKTATGTDYGAKIGQAINAGAPVEADGRISPAKFVAWLIEQH